MHKSARGNIIYDKPQKQPKCTKIGDELNNRIGYILLVWDIP